MTRCTIALEARNSSRRTNICTFEHSFARYVASSAAVSPAPTIATSWFLKKNPSHTAHAETPKPLYFCSDSKPNHFAVAPVAIITVSAVTCTVPSISTRCTSPVKSTLVTYPKRTEVPKRSACSRKSSIITGPVIPFG
ncbi:hypothetical protein D3C71_1513390 [compost metagenome]